MRLRLILGGALAVLIALILSWAAMSWLFERHIERREARELTRLAEDLVGSLAIDPSGAPQIAEPPADRRLDVPASGLYWQVSSPGGLVRSRSLWDEDLPTAQDIPQDRWRMRIATGRFEPRVLIVERTVIPDAGGPRVIVQVASAAEPLQIARREFSRDMAFYLGGLWLFLSGAAAAQVLLGLAPLARVRSDLDSLRRSPSARLSRDHPQEIDPLIDAINDLAQAREEDLARARRRAADLAHSLKTPLAALSAQSRRARDAGAAEAANGLDRAIDAVAATIETELARSRAAALRGDGGREAAVAAIAERLVGVLERTAEGERVAFDVDVDPALVAPVPHEALMEILGALIENASRHARRLVRIGAELSNDAIVVTVEDDGPGLEGQRAEAALMRGGRLDETGGGHGMGLAIVADVAEGTGGVLDLGRSDMGGLRVAIAWPGTAPPRR